MGRILKEVLSYFSCQLASYDSAYYEKQADKGSNRFNEFNDFVNDKYGDNTLINIMSETIGHKGTDSYKIRQIDKFWNEFINKNEKPEN